MNSFEFPENILRFGLMVFFLTGIQLHAITCAQESPEEKPEQFINPEWQDERDPSIVVKYLYTFSGGDALYYQWRDSILAMGRKEKATFLPYNTDAPESDARKQNLFVNKREFFHFPDIQITDKALINFLLGNFIYGEGPENIIFTKNGVVSHRVLGSDMVNNAMLEWYRLNRKAIRNNDTAQIRNIHARVYRFGYQNAFSEFFDHGLSIYNIPGFIGSAKISVYLSKNNILHIEVFNITSLSSGDLLKLGIWNRPVQSLTRDDSGRKQPYTNISQHFSVSIEFDTNKPLRSLWQYIKKF